MNALYDAKLFEKAVAEVRYAFENVPFFGEHYRGAGLDPKALRSPNDWIRVPPTRKADYRRNFPSGVLARGYTVGQKGITRSESSGTGGERLVTVTGSGVLTQRWFDCLTVNPAYKFLTGREPVRTCRYAPPNCSDVECANPNATMQDRMLPDRTLVLPVYHDLLTTPASMSATAAAEIGQYAPHLLFVDPTHLAFLVRYMRRAGIPQPPVGGIVCSFSMTTGVARRQIVEYFAHGTTFAEILAMSEFGWVLTECPKGRLHLNTASYLVELLTPDGRPAAPGELAELYLTGIGDKVSPHIRYQTGDFYRLYEGPCACGHRFPAVRMEGRSLHMLHKDGQIVATPRDIDDLVGAAPGIDLWQLEQGRGGEYVFRYIPNSAFEDALVSGIRERLLARLPGQAPRFERVDYIPTERSGKFQAVKSQIARDLEEKKGR